MEGCEIPVLVVARGTLLMWVGWGRRDAIRHEMDGFGSWSKDRTGTVQVFSPSCEHF